jgi:hypothetical protein
LGKYDNKTTVLKLAASKAAKAILGDTASGDITFFSTISPGHRSKQREHTVGLAFCDQSDEGMHGLMVQDLLALHLI